VCSHRVRSLYRNLDESTLAQLDQEKAVQVFEQGQGLFYEGGPSSAMYCVHSGYIKLYKTGPGGEELVIAFLGPGDSLGLSSMLAGEPHETAAVAATRALVCTIPRELIESVVRKRPEVALDMLAFLARSLRVSHEQIMDIAQRRVTQRVAHMLLTLHESTANGGNGNGAAGLRFKRVDMAHMVGTTPETLSRVLHKLQKRGLLEVTRAEIQVSDIEGLKALEMSRGQA
jgi:CRP-like cAMP-binding protein